VKDWDILAFHHQVPTLWVLDIVQSVQNILMSKVRGVHVVTESSGIEVAEEDAENVRYSF